MKDNEIYLKQTEPCESDARFLHRLMNNDSLLEILKEIPTQLSDWTEALHCWDHDPDEEDYIILDENEPVGWIGVNGLCSQDRTAYIKMVVLMPEYQDKGIGTKAVNQTVDQLIARGYDTFILYTDETNLRAQRCYQKCGFTIVETLIQEMSNGTLTRRCKMIRKI